MGVLTCEVIFTEMSPQGSLHAYCLCRVDSCLLSSTFLQEVQAVIVLWQLTFPVYETGEFANSGKNADYNKINSFLT